MLKTGKTFLRLYYQKHHRVYATSLNRSEISETRKDQGQDALTQSQEQRTQHIHDKLIFNSYLEYQGLSYGKRLNYRGIFYSKREERRELDVKQRTSPLPISLKYFTDEKTLAELNYIPEEEEISPPKDAANFPYQPNPKSRTIIKPEAPQEWMKDYDYFDDSTVANTEISKDILNHSNKSNYSSFDNEQKSSMDDEDYFKKTIEKGKIQTQYGTPNPYIEVSSVKCGGCGSLLHCKDTSIPGYLPSEIFLGRTKNQLHEITCQRCHFLDKYNVALNVTSDPADYPELLKQIRPQRALVVLMVDLLDFPCSVWPDVMDIIGTKRPVMIVGNKVDLLPEDSKGYLTHIRHCLHDSIKNSSISAANIKYVSLISAKTGYGVEEFITQLQSIWKYQGDVYLIGCTNVGKSTLFNALLQSDYCKEKAIDLMQRATISLWPGTTLNLLKFPILRPVDWRVAARARRLYAERAERVAEMKHRQMMAKDTHDPKYATLIGHIGRTFVNEDKVVNPDIDAFSYTMRSGFVQASRPMGIPEQSDAYRESKWCYDTPGVVHPDQIITLLTVEELMLTLPKAVIRPRTFHLHKGMTLFIAGLARVDFVECKQALQFTVFSSRHLPVTICKTKDADQVYSELLGTEYFAVPRGDDERMSTWPELKCWEKAVTGTGEGLMQAVVDVVLSSAGWVAVCGEHKHEFSLRAWTPEGRGIHVRQPALIQHASKMKGKRVQRTPAYTVGSSYCRGLH